MAEFTIPNHGEICWRELATGDSEKAQEFYKKLFGWNLEQSKVTEMDYQEIILDDKAFGGVMQMTKEWGDPLPPSHWMTYIAVDDVDAAATKIKEKGGGVCVEPFDAPGVGRMSVVNDPSGATFSLITFKME
ncbi:MAG: VOC family protein [Pyrinomonadaceae bacterium]